MIERTAHAAARWLAREQEVTAWMHRATARRWVLYSLAGISRLGDGWVWYALAAILPLFGGAVGMATSRRLIAVALLDIVIYKAVKKGIGRTRPNRASLLYRPTVAALDEFSFPSGHTLHAVACVVILSASYPAAAPFLWLFVALIALSRIVLGLHYPSDVLAGALIGASTAAISFSFF